MDFRKDGLGGREGSSSSSRNRVVAGANAHMRIFSLTGLGASSQDAPFSLVLAWSLRSGSPMLLDEEELPPLLLVRSTRRRRRIGEIGDKGGVVAMALVVIILCGATV